MAVFDADIYKKGICVWEGFCVCEYSFVQLMRAIVSHLLKAYYAEVVTPMEDAHNQLLEETTCTLAKSLRQYTDVSYI